MNSERTEVFVSYGREDLDFVRKLVDYLKKIGIKTWFDKDDMVPGMKWEEVLEDEIKKTKILLMLISRKSNERRGTIHKEQHDAIEASKYIPSGELYIMPVTLGECEIPRHLKQYHVENLAEEGSINKLIQTLLTELEKTVEVNQEDIKELLTVLESHLDVDSLNNLRLKNLFLNSTRSIESINIIQSIANSGDLNKLQVLLELSSLDTLSFAEIDALNLAINSVKNGGTVENLFQKVTEVEKEKISKMAIPKNDLLTAKMQLCKFTRYVSRKNSEDFKLAEKKIAEIIFGGIRGL